MAPNTLDFSTALVTGAGGGLGKEMARWLAAHGKKVIVAGRTEANVKQTAAELDCAYYVLDTGKLAAIETFVATVTTEHPDLDCLINNAGVQRPLELGALEPSEFLRRADEEIDINIRGPMHLCVRLVPHLQTKVSATIMNVSSVLGFVPFSVINPVYNGTKAFVHMFTMNLRTQLQRAGHGQVKVVEIAPPAVGTDLHRDRADPDDNKPHKNAVALSVEQFMEELVRGWRENRELCSAGPGVEMTGQWGEMFGSMYDKMAQ